MGAPGGEQGRTFTTGVLEAELGLSGIEVRAFITGSPHQPYKILQEPQRENPNFLVTKEPAYHLVSGINWPVRVKTRSHTSLWVWIKTCEEYRCQASVQRLTTVSGELQQRWGLHAVAEPGCRGLGKHGILAGQLGRGKEEDMTLTSLEGETVGNQKPTRQEELWEPKLGVESPASRSGFPSAVEDNSCIFRTRETRAEGSCPTQTAHLSEQAAHRST